MDKSFASRLREVSHWGAELERARVVREAFEQRISPPDGVTWGSDGYESESNPEEADIYARMHMAFAVGVSSAQVELILPPSPYAQGSDLDKVRSEAVVDVAHAIIGAGGYIANSIEHKIAAGARA